MARESVTAAEVNEAFGFSETVVVEEPKKEEAKKEEPKKGPAEEEEEEEVEKKEEPKKEEEEKKEPEKEIETPEDGKEKEEPKKEEIKNEEEEVKIEPTRVDSFLAKELEEYEITSLEEVKEILEGVEQLTDALQEERKKNKEPVFKSEAQKKAFEFITTAGYDPAKFGEGLLTHAKLVTMDVDGADDRTSLEEQYVIEHPELTREEATFKFNKRFKQKYEVSAAIEDEDERKDEQRSVDIEKKSDVAKAKKFLKQKQTEYKADDKQVDDKKVIDEVPAEVQTGIKNTLGEFNSFVDGFTEIIFTDDKDPDNTFTYKIPKPYLKQIGMAGKSYLSRPDIYNEKGVIPEFDPENYAVTVAMSLLGKEMIQSALKHTDRKAAILKVDEISKIKPEKKGGKSDGELKSEDPMDQWEKLADKKERERSQRRR